MIQSHWLQYKVFIKYRFRRWFNIFPQAFQKKQNELRGRQATPKKGAGSLVATLFLTSMLFGVSFFQSNMVIEKSFYVMGQTETTFFKETKFPGWGCDKSIGKSPQEFSECVPNKPLDGFQISAPVIRTVSLILIFFMIVLLLLNLTAKDLTNSEWDLEFLVTLPIPLKNIISMRILERTFVNSVSILIIAPAVLALTWTLGFGFFALPVTVLVVLLISFVEATLRTVLEIGMRIVFEPSRLRNFQSILSLMATIFMLFTFNFMANEKPYVMEISAASEHNWLVVTPIFHLVKVLASTSVASFFSSLSVLLAQITLLFFVTNRCLLHILRFGIVSGGSREGRERPKIDREGRERPKIDRENKERSNEVELKVNLERQSILKPIQRREIKLLLRDRNFLVQTLVLPLLVTIMQFVNLGGTSKTGFFDVQFNTISAIAFGAAAYAFLFSAFQVLNTEGKALWLLYILPVPLETVLKQKISFWIAIACFYPLLLYIGYFYFKGMPEIQTLSLIPMVIVGIFIYANVAACLGVFVSDPLAEQSNPRERVSITYLYMILTGFYTFAIYTDDYWLKIVLMILSGLMSLALFQKAKDQLPFLLDPTDAPKSSVSLSDGLIAALIFFVLQAIVALLFLVVKKRVGLSHDMSEMVYAFSIAGAVTYLSLNYIYWRKKTIGIPKIFGGEWLRSGILAVVVGLVAGTIGVYYQSFLIQSGLIENLNSDMDKTSLGSVWWLAALGIIAAPLFEEFIFRGVIFNGLLRTWSPWISILASSAIFAIVHPPLSVAPVFVMAVLATYVYKSSRYLIFPMIVHGVYNAVVLFL